MSEFCTINDGTTTISFFGNPDYKPLLKPVGAAYDPLGYDFTVVSVDAVGAKRGGTWTMVAVDPTSLLPTVAADVSLETMLREALPFIITFPDGRTMNVAVDPATPPTGAIAYSSWLFQYVDTWTVKFFEVS